MTAEFPRIIVISNNALSSVNANGKTLAALLCQFRKENVAQFYIRPEVPDTEVAGHYFRITDSEKLKSVFGRKKFLGQTVLATSMAEGRNTQFSSKTERNIFSQKKLLESGFARYLRERIWKNKNGSLAKLYQFIEEFKPNVILIYASRSAFMLDMASDIAEKYRIPLIIYTSEDEYFHHVPWYKPFARKCVRSLKASYSKVIPMSSSFITNQEQLAELFRQEFKSPVQVIYPSSSIKPSSLPVDVDKPYFLYAGNVTNALKRCESLLDVANALGKINPAYRLNVFPTNASKRTIRKLSKNAYILLHKPVAANQLGELINKSTIVFHVESFSRKIKGLISNAFSSKIPDLLGAGRPVLVYAPSDCSFYQYLNKEEATVLASSKIELEKGIRNILESGEYRAYLGEQSLALFRKNHQAIDNGLIFYKEVEKASKQMRKPVECFKLHRNLRLNRWIVPVLFVYFLFSLFPTMLPYITFLPDIFTSPLIELAWKGFVFAGLTLFFLLLIIKNHLRFNWKLSFPIVVYALSNLIVIALTPASTLLSSLNTGTLLEYEVIISTSTKIAGIFQVLSTGVLTYVFITLLPKTILLKRQLFLLFYLVIGFLVLSGLYSIVFEKDRIIGLFTAENPYEYNVHSFFEDKNTYGKYLLGGIMMSCYLASQSRVKWQFGLSALLFGFLVTTLSKTPILVAFALFIMLFIYYVFVRFERHPIANSVLLFVAFGFITYGACLLTIPAMQALPINGTIYHYVTVSVFQYGVGTVNSRIEIWKAGIELLSGGHLFFGYGEKIASVFLLGNTTVYMNVGVQYFHNGLLQVTAVGGLLYLMLYLALFAYLIIVYFKIGKKDKDSRFVFMALFITFCIHATFEEAILSNTSVYSFITTLVIVVAPIMTLRMQKTNYIGELKRDLMTSKDGKLVSHWEMEKPTDSNYNLLSFQWYKNEMNRRVKNKQIKQIAKEEKYNLKMQKWRDKHAWNE